VRHTYIRNISEDNRRELYDIPDNNPDSTEPKLYFLLEKISRKYKRRKTSRQGNRGAAFREWKSKTTYGEWRTEIFYLYEDTIPGIVN